MEVEIYLEHGNIDKKKVCLGGAINYGQNRDDIIKRYSYCESNKNKEKYISDKSIEDILKTSYFKFGIIPRELFLDLDNDQDKSFYILQKVDKNLLNDLNGISMPFEILSQLNNYIDSCHTYLDLIHKNYEILSDLDNILMNKLYNYRNQFNNVNSIEYFDKVLYFNRIRNFINEIKHEKIMDFQYFYTNLLKYKYFSLLEEENVISINKQVNGFDELYNLCHQSIRFIDENNEKKYYEVKNGSIKIHEIIEILKKYIDLF